MENKVKNVLSGIGFYGTLAVCLLVVGVCGWVLLQDREDPLPQQAVTPQVPVSQPVEMPEVRLPTVETLEPAPVPVPPKETKELPEVEVDHTPVAAEAPRLVVAPLRGDVLTAFPSILLALVVISLLGPGKTGNVIIALGLVFIPSFARMARGTYASLREVNYVKSARLMGASSARIIIVHILPNIMPVLLPAMTIGFNNAVLAEASMSYLGIGVTPPDASLGYMLSEAQGMLTSAPWYALGTGGAIVLLIFGVGLIGEGLQRRNGEVA